jgi:curved DNA-binding protein CbpA
MKNLYHILAVDANCNQLEIQQAYDKLQLEFATSSTQNKLIKYRYKEICRAYRVLNDPIKRRKYDLQFQAFLQPKQNYTKAIDITFTIILVFFTCVFGDYVITSFQNHKLNHPVKIAKLQKVPVKFTGLHTVGKRKKRFAAKIKPVNNGQSSLQQTTAVIAQLPVKQFATENYVDAESVLPAKKTTEPQNLVDKQSIPTEPDFLYETNLKANETGKINLRQTDSYNSAIIEVVPGGAKVAVLEKGSVYYKVRFENSVGFVPKWTLVQK